MILDNEFSGDLRVENEVITLQHKGFDVFVLCLNFGSKKKIEEFYGAKIYRISISKNIKKKLAALNNTIFNFYPIFWSKHIKQFIKENNIDVLHVHDLWMLNSAFKANKKIGLPVVADLHENYVEALKYYKYANTFPGNIIISKNRWVRSEIKWCRKSDYLITVIEEAVERYKDLGISESKISVVANYVNIKNFLTDKIDESIVKKFHNYFTVTYVGGFDIHRGLEIAIKAVPLVVKEAKNFKLILVGSGRNFNNLKQLVGELKINDYVAFEGWKPSEKLISYIKASDICLIPHLKTGHTDNTIPHKLFQYMILEKPVIASNCNPIKRILNETKAGLVYNSSNPIELAEKIILLYKQNELRRKMGINGKESVINKYNWNEAGKNLISLYKKIESKKRVD